MSSDESPKPDTAATATKGWKGGPGWTVIAMLSGLALAWVVFVIARPHVIAAQARPDDAVTADQLFAIEAYTAAVVGMIGVLTRAMAHNDSKNMDYVGKLIAVSTVGFALLAAQAKLLPALSALIVAFFITFAGLVIVFVAIAGVWRLRKRKPTKLDKKGDAAPAGK